tara:strand:+ start:717 stop:1076 length:360 start_codon:yes stop_codon:yes gene_type:complete
MSWVKLLYVIGMVESGLNPLAINHKENAFGQYQLRPIYIQCVNSRLPENEKFINSDAFNPEQAKKIVKLYITYWIKVRDLELNYENACRLHNGGSGFIFKKHKTNYYWSKCQKVLKTLN